ncbi:hypothetical protein PMAC_003185 [Pneumocystis sp. 'macacae']|nr:hypothetical protein PMAC_003185 [Pneumocystis sp. 'macacae']
MTSFIKVDTNKSESTNNDNNENLALSDSEDNEESAFNPKTGEINWDCPCLGGMAHGPCGEEFKSAFSCFVYSEEEPKGIECIEKFQIMQNCFRKYPEIYNNEEINNDDDIEINNQNNKGDKDSAITDDYDNIKSDDQNNINNNQNSINNNSNLKNSSE